jgi:hydrogenase expression/formation protein HypC
MCLAVPGRVVECPDPSDELAYAVVEFAGVRRRVCLACVPEARPGDYVIVHAGVAISRVDPAEARRVFACLNDIGDDGGWPSPARPGGKGAGAGPDGGPP